MKYYGTPLQEAIEGSPKDTRPNEEPIIQDKKEEPPKTATGKNETPKMDDGWQAADESTPFPFETPLDELKYRANQAGIELSDIKKACIRGKNKKQLHL